MRPETGAPGHFHFAGPGKAGTCLIGSTLDLGDSPVPAGRKRTGEGHRGQGWLDPDAQVVSLTDLPRRWPLAMALRDGLVRRSVALPSDAGKAVAAS